MAKDESRRDRWVKASQRLRNAFQMAAVSCYMMVLFAQPAAAADTMWTRFSTIIADVYEIVVLYDGEQHLARLLQPQEDLRYIFVLPHIRMAQELVLPSVPCLFATVDYNGQEVPDVRFYTESEGGRDGAV